MSDPLAVRGEGRVRVLTLDRPDVLNAIDDRLFERLADELVAAATDGDVGAVVLTGAGRAFCAGIDVTYLAEIQAGRAGIECTERFVDVLHDFPKPLLVAVNGLAVGIGTTLCGFADLVFASTSARFRTPFTAMGVGPEMSSSWNLPQMIGWQNAAWMLLSSAWVDAAEAREMGLAFRLVDPGALVDETVAAATAIAGHPLPSIVATKAALRIWRKRGIEDAAEFENERFVALLSQRSGLTP